MKFSNDSYDMLCKSVRDQAADIDLTASHQKFDVEESVKNGSAETIIGMITELESTLRVLKRRLNAEINPQPDLFNAAGVNLLASL